MNNDQKVKGNISFASWLTDFRKEETEAGIENKLTDEQAQVAYESGYTPEGTACEEAFSALFGQSVEFSKN